MTSYEMADVIRLTGAKRSQVENWCRSGLIAPAAPSPGTGIARRFDFVNLVEFAVAAELSRWGMPAPKMGEATGAALTWLKDRARKRTAIDDTDALDVRGDIVKGAAHSCIRLFVGRIVADLERATGESWIEIKKEIRR
jgi:hypothetical protein